MTRGAMRIQTGLSEFILESPVAPSDTFVTWHLNLDEGMDEEPVPSNRGPADLPQAVIGEQL